LVDEEKRREQVGKEGAREREKERAKGVDQVRTKQEDLLSNDFDNDFDTLDERNIEGSKDKDDLS
jgi:hypothetical protein